MKTSKRSTRKHKGMSPTTVRFTPQVLDVLQLHAKATGLSASQIANVMILTGHHAAAGNLTPVNATRKLLSNYELAHREDGKAAATRAALSQRIRDAKAVLNGTQGAKGKQAEQKPNVA